MHVCMYIYIYIYMIAHAQLASVDHHVCAFECRFVLDWCSLSNMHICAILAQVVYTVKKSGLDLLHFGTPAVQRSDSAALRQD